MRRLLLASLCLAALLAAPSLQTTSAHADTQCGKGKTKGYCATLNVVFAYGSTPHTFTIALQGSVTYYGEDANDGFLWVIHQWSWEAPPKGSAQSEGPSQGLNSPFLYPIGSARCSAERVHVHAVAVATNFFAGVQGITVSADYDGPPPNCT